MHPVHAFFLGFAGFCILSASIALWSIAGQLGDIKTTMQDDRAILSDMRDALNCQTWPHDPACTQEYPTGK